MIDGIKISTELNDLDLWTEMTGIKLPERIHPRPDTTGGKNKQRAANWDIKFGKTHNPDGTPKLTEGTTGVTPPNAPSSDNSINDAEMKKLQRQNSMPPTPPAVTEAPASSAVATMSTENQNLNIQASTKNLPSTTTNTIVKAVGKFVSVVSTNSIVLVKQANKLVSAISNSAVATTKTINKTVSKTISSTATLLYGFLFVRSLSVVTTTTSTISNIKSLFRTVTTNVVSSVAAILKARNLTLLFSASANPYISTRTARFVLLVTNVYTNVVSYVHRILPNVVDTLFVPTKKTLVTVAGFVSVLVRPKKTNIVASKQDDIYG